MIIISSQISLSILLCVCQLFLLQVFVKAERLSNSPYPVCSQGLNSSTKLFVIDDANLSQDEIITLESIQGWSARFSPLVFRLSGDDTTNLWLETLVNTFQITIERVDDVWDLVDKVLSQSSQSLSGYVLYTSGSEDSTNAAISVCSTDDMIAIGSDIESNIFTFGLSKLYDASNWTQFKVWDLFGSNSFSHHISSLQAPSKATCLADYSIFSKAFTWFPRQLTTDFFISPSSDIFETFTRKVLGSLDDLSAIMGWGPNESNTVKEVSKANGGFVHASDYAKNLATLSNFDIPQHYQKDSVNAQLDLFSTEDLDNVHTICFLMTDGDNIQWLLNDFTSNSDWWASPYRGQVPIGWTISPALTELAPSVMKWLYDNSTRNSDQSAGDFFVAGPSGIGYSNPDQITNDTILRNYAELSGDAMAKADIRILNVISDEWNQNSSVHFLEHSQIDAIFWYQYYSYISLNGEILFVNDKPIIGGRYQLWDGEFDNSTSLAIKLQALPKDPTSEMGYSLIPVHVWTNSVYDVMEVVENLGSGFRIVSPQTFVSLISQNIPH